MEIVSFGRTGLKVSKLCFGTMTIGSSSTDHATSSTTMSVTRCRAIWAVFRPVHKAPNIRVEENWPSDMEQHEIERSTMDLIDAVREIFEAELANATDATPILDRALALMLALYAWLSL